MRDNDLITRGPDRPLLRNPQTGAMENPYGESKMSILLKALLALGVPAGMDLAGVAAGGAGAAGSTSVQGPGGTVANWAAGGANATDAAASSLPGWVKPAVGIGGPLVARALTDGSGNGDDLSASPQSAAQMQQLLQLLIDRANRQTPVHEAAMRMATAMAPSMQMTPRMGQAIETAQTPRSTAPGDPQVLSAIQRLMAGGR
jgi:hypothetical protein